MSPAPILKGYLCRVCGEERIQTPWNDSDGFKCGNCGAENLAPLLSTSYDIVNFTPLLPGDLMFQHEAIDVGMGEVEQ